MRKASIAETEHTKREKETREAKGTRNLAYRIDRQKFRRSERREEEKTRQGKSATVPQDIDEMKKIYLDFVIFT